MNYDAIVIGAGNGGLIAALTLQKAKKKVLLLESHNLPGGVATTFKRGRFEFEASLHELCQYGTEETKGDVRRLFEQLGVADKIPMVDTKETVHIQTLDTLEEYTMPVGVEQFTEKMEQYVPGSKQSMNDFFELCKETKEAFAYLNESKGHPDVEILKTKYKNFMVVSSYSVTKVLNAIKMPQKAQEILCSYWLYLGSPATELSFVHYASMVYSYIENHPVIPLKKSHELSLTLYEEFEKLGGTGKFLTPVSKIIVENNEVKGVETADKTKYFAKNIISNVSPNMVYGKLIEKDNVPQKARQLTNSRTFGARGVCVYLGLNKSPKELGLDHYSYFITHTLDSKKEFERMKHLKGDNLVAVVVNNAVPSASPKGTTLLNLTSLIFSDTFDHIVTKENYFELKEAIAENLIEVFETATKIKIRDSIEEIEIATPLTFARYTGHPEGVIYGYLAKASDNLLPRIMNMNQENYIDGLYFAGGFGPRLSGYSSTYMSGYMAANSVLQRLEKDSEGQDETKN